jgi:TPP-dependent indolepyruvate ferredoxin oxidoreductase alpha subunit
LRKLAKAEGERKIVILTARGSYKPVKDYLEDIGLRDIYVVALNSADPQDKADWIEQKIKEGYDDVFFIDDSHKNVQAVKALEKKYPDIKLQVRHVQHNIPTAPKETNEIKLKSLLPKKL